MTIKLIELETELNELNKHSEFWGLTELEIQRLEQIVNELSIEFKMGLVNLDTIVH